VSPLRNTGARICSTQARKHSALLGPSSNKCAMSPSQVRLARNVVVFPMAVWRMAEGACTDVGPSVTTRHCCRRPSLVDENQRPAGLFCALPRLPLLSDIGMILFAGAHGFFEADPLGGEEALQHRLVGLDAVRAKQALGDRVKRQIVLPVPQCQQPVPMPLQHRTPVSAGR